MNILALEFSTDRATLAAWAQNRLISEVSVDARNRRSQEIFPATERLLGRIGWTFREIQRFAVGRGPGSYTGLRVSLTAAQGWALPWNIPIITVSSALALAAEQLTTHSEWNDAVICGDARKGRVWAARFARNDHGEVLQDGEIRFFQGTNRGEWDAANWVDSSCIPRAEWVARLAADGRPTEPLTPIYTNPAVLTVFS